ncbi:MAG TPA: maleylpyruvate isomerase family mycothiol-dependent enzyme [Micromonospora sp.]
MTRTDQHPDQAASDTGGRLDLAYQRVRANMAALLAEQPDPATAVPTCPGWTVAGLVAHSVEVCAMANAQVTGTAPATDTTGGIPELLAEWERLSGPVDRALATPGPAQAAMLIMDAFTHELDLRLALGAPPPVDHPALPVAVGFLVKGLATSLRGHGLPALRIESEHGHLVAGDGEPGATMAGPWHEVYLSLAGRRTAEQIGALRWSADPARWLPAFTWGPFVVPDPARTHTPG